MSARTELVRGLALSLLLAVLGPLLLEARSATAAEERRPRYTLYVAYAVEVPGKPASFRSATVPIAPPRNEDEVRELHARIATEHREAFVGTVLESDRPASLGDPPAPVITVISWQLLQ